MNWKPKIDGGVSSAEQKPVAILGRPLSLSLVLAPDLRGPVRNLLTGHLSTS